MSTTFIDTDSTIASCVIETTIIAYQNSMREYLPSRAVCAPSVSVVTFLNILKDY